LADDHAIVRQGLRRLIDDQPDMKVAGEAWDGESASELVRRRPVDVLLLDLEMPQLSGLEAVEKIRRRSPATRIVILTHCPAKHFAVKAIEYGVDGWLGKECEADEIIAAIRAVASGRRHFPAEVTELLLQQQLDEQPSRMPHEALNAREFQLLLRFARGQSTSQIADELSLSPRSVSTYHGNMLHKLGLHTRSEMVHYAIRHGLVG
jgi:DNA-binding NarL/FixJ family response regulator